MIKVAVAVASIVIGGAAISHIVRAVLAPLIPSSQHGLSWCASINCVGRSLGGAVGGWRDDWKMLGIDTSAWEFKGSDPVV